MSFPFGKAGGIGSGGFNFGAAQTATTSGTGSAGGFSFGATPTAGGTSKPTGFTGFGVQTTSQTTGGINFAQTGQQTAPPSLGFGQTATTKPSEGFSFGQQSKPSTGFNFGTPSNQQQAPSTTVTTTPVQPQQQTGGFSFGTQATQQTSGTATQQTTGFNFGLAGTKPTTGTQQQQQPTVTGLFGSSVGGNTTSVGGGNPVASTQQTGGFNFGAQGQTTQTLSVAPQSSSTGFTGLGGQQQQQKPPPSFSLATSQQSVASTLPKPSALSGLLSAPTSNPPAALAQPQTSSGVLQLGGSTGFTGQPTAGFKMGSVSTGPTTGGFALVESTAKTTSAQATGFAFTAPKTTGGLPLGSGNQASQSLSLGDGKTSVSTLPSLTATTTAGASTGFRLGGVTTTSTGGISLGGKPLGQPTATPTTTSAATVLTLGKTSGATTTTSGGAVLSTVTQTTASTSVPPSMNYRQLEEQINKWSLELEEQEKVFIQQATQVNAWDRLLIDNGDKISQLNTDVERVKLDQQRLDQELDFILAQQRELAEMLVPLEQAVEQIPAIHYQQHADLEREHTYKMAENIDAQLKRMVQDLKEIIDHINASNTNQDNTDPVQQIAKVLNAHMDSLQWIDQNTVVLQRRVEEVAKRADQRKNEQERNLRLAYD